MRRFARYRPWDQQQDIDRLCFLMSQAFGVEESSSRTWITESPGKQVRCVDCEGVAAPDACLILIPMGQFFGGRSVPMTGVAGVAVSPEARGAGLASTMMVEALREMRASGAALSALFAATQPVYRKVGYEQAGALWHTSIDPSHLRNFRDPDVAVTRLSRDDLPRLREGYTDHARLRDGYLDRGDYIWDRVFKFRAAPSEGWGFTVDGALEGAVFTLNQPGADRAKRSMALTDIWANTPRALRRIGAFLANHASVVREIHFFCALPSPLLLAMQEQSAASISLKDFWMLRVVDVTRALEARGYPPGARAALDLEIVDDVLRENSGVYRMIVDEGAARVERAPSGGATRAGRVRTDVRDLAAMYTGFAAPQALAAITGRVEGDEQSLATLAQLFAGPPPGMCDPF